MDGSGKALGSHLDIVPLLWWCHSFSALLLVFYWCFVSRRRHDKLSYAIRNTHYSSLFLLLLGGELMKTFSSRRSAMPLHCLTLLLTLHLECAPISSPNCPANWSTKRKRKSVLQFRFREEIPLLQGIKKARRDCRRPSHWEGFAILTASTAILIL
jgi:hypothetical protein